MLAACSRHTASVPVLASKFDNLKDGAPALVKAPTSSQNATAAKPAGAV